MKIENDIITFKSSPKYFYNELNGIKNNTVLIVTPSEKDAINRFCKENLPYRIFIHIINTETQVEFHRRIRDISYLEIPNSESFITVFTWDTDAPTCCSKCGKPVTPDIQIEFSKEEYGEYVCVSCEE